MKKLFIPTLIFGLFVNNSVGQDLSADTAKIYPLKEVVITATRIVIPLNESPSTVELLTKEQISRTNASTIADVLLNSSGIFIKDYGPTGGLKTLSIRGTTAEHNLILINGSKVNNFQNGLVDLSLLPVENIERIEVVHGGNSALYGSDAIGGVINILTDEATNELKLKLTGTIGSYGYNKYQIGFSDILPGQISLSFNYINEYGDDNYRYKLIGSNIMKNRENANFKRQNLYLSTDYSFDNSIMRLSSSYTNSSRGVPGILTFPSLNASQADKVFSTQFIFNNSSLNNINLKLSSSFYYSHQKYENKDWAINSFSKNIHYNINPQIDYTLNGNILIATGAEFIEGKLEGVDYQSKIKRQQQSIYLTGNLSYIFDNHHLKKISFYPTLRYDKFSNFKGEVIPKIGAAASLFGDIFFRSSYGINYRIPTLNDLYYVDSLGNKGNPDLKPEYSKTFDVGINKSFNMLGKVIIDGSYFKIDTREKILWLPTPMWTYLPKNIGKVSSQGFSVKLNWMFNRNIEFEGNYTFTDARKRNSEGLNDPTYNKQLIYTPKEVAKFGLNLNYDFVSLNLYQQFVSKSYVDEANTKTISPFSVLNANILMSLKTGYGKYWIKLEMNNLLDRDYQIIADYPMSLRTYRVTLGIEY